MVLLVQLLPLLWFVSGFGNGCSSAKRTLLTSSSTSSSYTSANTACKKQQAVSKQQPNFVLKHTSATQKGHAFEPERVAVWQSAGESIRT